MNLKSSPWISIVVPVYNKDKQHLKKCFDSLKNQTFKDTEVLLIDDGSEKSVAHFTKNYAKNLPNFHYYRQNNQGVSATRNTGLEKSSGRYIMFIDADDWLDKDCCAKVSEHFDRLPQIIAFSYYKEYDGKSVPAKIATSPFDMTFLGTSCMKAYQKAFLQNRTFDTTLNNGEDVEFNIRLLKNLQLHCLLPNRFYHYRITPESSVRAYDPRMVESYEKTLVKIRKDLRDTDTRELEDCYYTFAAVAYLMIVLNYIYHSENSKDSRSTIEALRQKTFVKELFANTSRVHLSPTRQLPLLRAKHRLYAALKLAVQIKQRQDHA